MKDPRRERGRRTNPKVADNVSEPRIGTVRSHKAKDKIAKTKRSKNRNTVRGAEVKAGFWRIFNRGVLEAGLEAEVMRFGDWTCNSFLKFRQHD